ncbi:MAG: GNAT family N-acetyltransferase [Armatimonadetes bacterium]|nr:GNAT family N-acetyltransferase [Armatimonadota bacterium]
MLSIPEAIEVFVHAFCEAKSRTYPYAPTLVDGLWIMRDTPDRKNARKIEIVTHGIEPAKAAKTIQDNGIGWHFLSEIHPVDADFDAIRAEYKSLGYKAVSTEWLFVHELNDIPIHESEPPVRPVTSQAMLDAIPQRGKHKHVLRPNIRKFSIWDDETEYGWVNSIPFKNAAWVGGLFVHESDRGRGYGRALMSALLQSDRDHGVQTSVLLASSDGARLYPHLGYQKIGVLQMFCPKNRS